MEEMDATQQGNAVTYASKLNMDEGKSHNISRGLKLTDHNMLKSKWRTFKVRLNFGRMLWFVVWLDWIHHFVMEGYTRRIWARYDVERIVDYMTAYFWLDLNQVNAEISLQCSFFFDKKPLIVYAWYPDSEQDKNALQQLPIWV